MRLSVRTVLAFLAVSIAITCAHVLFAVFIQDQPFPKAYTQLSNWDSNWYGSIVRDGYQTEENIRDGAHENNGAFFPGYPVMATIIALILLVQLEIAMLLTAQIFCVLFWLYFLLLLRRMDIGPVGMTVSVLFVLAYPTSFFLITAYSESTFLCALLGYIFWSGMRGRAAGIIAAVHGVLMTATRLVGLPLVMYPVLLEFLQKKKKKVSHLRGLVMRPRSLLIAVASCLGILAFFVFGASAYGSWSFYFDLQKSGWNVDPQYLFPIHSLFAVEDSIFSVDQQLSHAATAAGLRLFLVLVLCELVRCLLVGDDSWKKRLPLYACAVFIAYISIAGMFTLELKSMSRYMLMVHIFQVMIVAHFVRTLNLKIYIPGLIIILCGCLIILLPLMQLQAVFLRMFTEGYWVA